MWISKKALERKLFERQYEAQQKQWELDREQRQNETIYSLTERIEALEIKTGIKTTPKRCHCASEIVRSV